MHGQCSQKDRYIPTLVGRLGVSIMEKLKAPVHPHACGEICHCVTRCRSCHGTSPRLWGDSPHDQDQEPLPRYIPTLVGRFLPVKTSAPYRAVHPHACGEIFPCIANNIWSIGTSPRLWGDCSASRVYAVFHRYIPTLVGRFSYESSPCSSRTVHPHACGEIRRFGNSLST